MINIIDTKRITLVVVNENTLGFVMPKEPKLVGILHASILKGACTGLNAGYFQLGDSDIVRLAKEKDFKEYRVSFEDYKDSNKYKYSTQKGLHGTEILDLLAEKCNKYGLNMESFIEEACRLLDLELKPKYLQSPPPPPPLPPKARVINEDKRG
jgi:hypothetical protein